MRIYGSMSELEQAAGTMPSDALEALYRRVSGRAEALARGLTGDPDLAQDIAQEAFVRAAGHVIHLRDPAAFDAYLRRTVVNLCHQHFRRLGTERRGLHRVGPSPETVPAEHPEDRDALWAAVQRLPYRQRAAIVLRYYEDLSEEQTALTLRCSARAVNALVSRAMAELRDHVEEIA